MGFFHSPNFKLNQGELNEASKILAQALNWLVPAKGADPQMGCPLHEPVRDLLLQMLQAVDESICGVDESGRIVFLNASAERSLGYEAEALLGQPFSLLESERRGIWCAVADVGVWQGQGELLVRQDGSSFPVAWRWVPLMLNQPGSGAMLLFRDITERRRMEQAIQESRARFDRAFMDPPIGKVFMSTEGLFLRVNPYFCQLLGYEPSELVGRSYLDFTHPQDRGISRESVRKMLSGELQSIQFNKRYLHRSGDVIYLKLTVSMIRDESGQPISLMGQLQDITRLTDVEEALQESQARFRRAFEDAAIGMVIVSLDQTYINVNPRFCNMLGYQQAELLLQPTAHFMPAEDAALDADCIQRMINGELETCAYEKRYIHRNGQIVWADVTTSSVRDEAGTLLYFVRQAQDITERKQADEQLRQARAAAEASAAAKADFLAMISHEIRTPMNAVLGMASLLGSTELSLEQRELVETIKSSGNTLMDMMSDILDFSKIESGKMELDLHPFVLTSVIEEVCALFRPRMLEKGLRFSVQVDENVPELLLGDSKRLMQVLVNLIGNAVKFTDAGEIRVSAQVEGGLGLPASGSASDGWQLGFRIEDTGCGIPSDKLQVIFDSFTQVTPSTFRQYGGTGLGLAICYSLVQMMNGHIGVESTLGSGSAFHFSIPVSALGTAGFQATYPETCDEALEMNPDEHGPLRILVAEDNRVNQQLMLHFLEGLGYDVTLVSDGLAVLEALETQPFDLIFMDIQMPRMDGLEASRAINDRYGVARPRIIALTAFGRSDDRQRCLNAGMDDYVTKPIRLGQLAQMLKSWPQWGPAVAVPNKADVAPPCLHSLVDVPGLMARLGRDPEQIRCMVELFEEESELLLEALSQAVREQDDEAMLRHLHQLKGACLALSLNGLKEMVVRLEKQVKYNGLSQMAPEVTRLGAALKQAQAELKQALGEASISLK